VPPEVCRELLTESSVRNKSRAEEGFKSVIHDAGTTGRPQAPVNFAFDPVILEWRGRNLFATGGHRRLTCWTVGQASRLSGI